MFRFLHSADLHLGKPFGGYPETVRHDLRQAREGVIGRLAVQARAQGCAHVLLAGDTFDAQTPSPRVIRQALNAVAGAADLTFVLLPGNHDSLAATELWGTIARDAPANLRVVTDTAPASLAPGVVLLAAPATARRPGQDLTEALMQPTPDGSLRIGLAHGAVTDFSKGEDGNPAVIPPDRAERAGLAYLALGDWHGQMPIGPRTWYAGTPEPDSFRHGAPGRALVVSCGPGLPQVTPVETGVMRWLAPHLDSLPGDDLAHRLRGLLPSLGERGRVLIDLTFAGRVPLPAVQAVQALLDQTTPDFLHLHADMTGLITDIRTDDLDLIDRAGALRAAAEALLAEADDPARPAPDQAIARAALADLFALCRGLA
jgi:hypothetical protein